MASQPRSLTRALNDNAQQPQWYLGLISGTSYDAIDFGLLLTDGRSIAEHGPLRAYPLAPALREQLRPCMGRASAPDNVTRAVTEAHVVAARDFLKRDGDGRAIRAVEFQGAARHFAQLPITFPTTTGVRQACADGRSILSQP